MVCLEAGSEKEKKMSNEDCLFCKIVQNEIPAEKIYEDNEVMGFKDLYPQAKIHQIYSVIQTTKKGGMRTMNHCLNDLVLRRLISMENALSRTMEPEELQRILQRQ